MRFSSSHFAAQNRQRSCSGRQFCEVSATVGEWFVEFFNVVCTTYIPFKYEAAPHVPLYRAYCTVKPSARQGRKLRMKNALLPRVTYHHRIASTTIFFNVCIFQRFWCYCPRDLRPGSGSFSWKSSGRSLFARFCVPELVNHAGAIQ